MAKFVISAEGGKITVTDSGPKAWENYLSILDTLSKKTRSKSAIVMFEGPEITRCLLDAVTREDLEKKYKIIIHENASEMPVKVAEEIIETAKGFDIAVKFDAIELIFFHTGRLEALTEMKLAPALLEFLRKMFPRATLK